MANDKSDDESDDPKTFGMRNLFFGNPDNIELPKLPVAERSTQPARQLNLRPRQQITYDEEDDDFMGDDSDNEANEAGEAGEAGAVAGTGEADESNPIQTAFGARHKRPASPDTKTAPKRKRIEGGRAAQAKKVTADLDSEDEIIVQMKQKNFSDRDVAYQLVSEGRINYDRKTIATRWARLRKALAEREDQLLDEDLTDWHEGEDEILVKAYHRAARQVEHEVEKAQDKLWRYTSDLLRRERAASRYSPRACKQRYEALLNGTARIPPELDDDPAARAAERQAKIEAKQREKDKQERQKKELERRAKLEAERKEQQRKEEAAKRKARKEQEALEKKRKSFDANVERENKKKEVQQTKLDAKLYEERARQEQKLRKEQAAVKKAQDVERQRQSRQAITQARAKKDLELRQAKEAAARAKLEAIQKGREIKEMQQQARDASGARSRNWKGRSLFIEDDDMEDEEEDSNINDNDEKMGEGEATAVPESPSTGALSSTEAVVGSSTPNIPSFKPLNTPVSRSFASSGVDKISPRKNMSNEELVALLRERGTWVPARTGKKNMLSQLAVLDKKMHMDDLKKEMKTRGLKLSGSKADLIHRLATDDATRSSNAQDLGSNLRRVLSIGGEASTNASESRAESSTSAAPTPQTSGNTAGPTNEESLDGSDIVENVEQQDIEMRETDAPTAPAAPTSPTTGDLMDTGNDEALQTPQSESHSGDHFEAENGE
ncbi:MAG: hypothetical protein M1821_009480 [Bathelium mastoideum]|nr:MAG: hypothetical protein M1821_009480 [Bathelium mastoideum]